MSAEPKDGAKKHPGGRPKRYAIPIPKCDTVEGKIEEMASYSLSAEEIASILGLTRDALYKSQSYSTALKRGHQNCDASLRRRQYLEAMKGNTTMLVWLGKQRLGQKDKSEIGGPDGKAIPLTLEAAKASLAEIFAVIASRRSSNSTEESVH